MGRFRIFFLMLTLLATTSLVFYSCEHKAHQLEFISLGQFNSADTNVFKGKKYTRKSFYFIMKGYHDRKYDRKKIDSFAFALKKKYTDVAELSVSFYEYSETTNPKNLKRYPRDFYRDTQDEILFKFVWSNEELIRKVVYDDGRIISPR